MTRKEMASAKNKYNKLIEKISELVTTSRTELARIINTKIVYTYFEQKGKERADYGSELMVTLSKELSAKLGKGFSRSNLQNMRLIYLNYPKNQTLSGKLNWSHYCMLLSSAAELQKDVN